MLRRIVLLALIFVLAGCGFLEGKTATTTTTVAPPDDTAATATTLPTTTVVEKSPCLEGDRPFADNGLISAFGGPQGDATQIAGIQWFSYPGCEQTVIEFLTADGAPAGALDPVGVEYNAEAGVIRINLPTAVDRSAVADSLLDGELITRAYVVASGDGLVIDLHLTPGRRHSVRAYEIVSPSRVVVDVRENVNARSVIGATIGSDVVVVDPTPGFVDGPLRVRGYVKAPYETVTADLIGSGATVDSETSSAGAGTRTWREFTAVFDEVPATTTGLVVTPDGGAEHAVEVAIEATIAEDPIPPEE